MKGAVAWFILAALIALGGLLNEKPEAFVVAVLLAIAGYLHLIAVAAHRPPADAEPSADTSPDSLAAILAELRWQRQQKEKELARAKAAAKPPAKK